MSRNNLRTILMPFAMIAGGLLHNFVARLEPLIPWLIFAMLFIPFCGVGLRQMRLSGLHITLLLFQVAMAVVAYLVAGLFDEEVAQGAMICFLAPTATSAVVIAAMLGARASTMITYSLFVNIAVALVAPLFFLTVAQGGDVSFGESFVAIFLRVVPVIVLPFVAAILLRWFSPRIADVIGRFQSLSFYLWLVALATVTGRTVNFVATQAELSLAKGLVLAGVALVVCAVQFGVGRYIGSKWGETVAGGQLLGQKNTILAIWLAQSYLNPVSSIAPAAYVLWQNIFNTIQIWRKSQEGR